MESAVHQKVIRGICNNCHRKTGDAETSGLVFEVGPQFLKLETINLERLTAVATRRGADYILKKVRGASPHGGGVQLTPDAEYYALLEDFLAPYTLPTATPVAAYKPTLESPELTFRRASLLLTGAIPGVLPPLNTDSDLAAALDGLFEQETFYDFIKRSANDRLLTRSINMSHSLDFYLTNFYPMYFNTANSSGAVNDFKKSIYRELGEAPLELISYVVRNNRPYTEILTANYTMVSKYTAIIYEANVSPAQDEYLPAKDEGQMVSISANPLPSHNWDMATRAYAEPVGILSSAGFLQQYQTNATNRNRARARWTYQHFLGIDIENSSSRNIDASVLIDVQGGIPTRLACKVCHDRIDPVAGAFQRYGARGTYLDGAFGIDTLDAAYKRTAFYKPGDTWYRSMLPPGFEGETFDLTSNTGDKNPLRLLAEKITTHPKFAEGTVKFWWPALFGEELLHYHLDEAHFSARQQWLTTTANTFIADGYDFKKLMRNILMSPFFRSAPDALNPFKKQRRLLTPEELRLKTLSLSGHDDTRLLRDWHLMYGGIDSYNVEQRQRAFSTMMYQAARLHATDVSCTLIASLSKTEVNSATVLANKVSVIADAPINIHSDYPGHQLHLKNDQTGPVLLTVRFSPAEGTEEEFTVSLPSAKSGWSSNVYSQKGVWIIKTASTSAVKLQTAVITRDKDKELNEWSKLAFSFWGDKTPASAQRLYDFYVSTAGAADHTLTEGCISINGMAGWKVSELARWRLVYVRMMSDYQYLYE